MIRIQGIVAAAVAVAALGTASAGSAAAAGQSPKAGCAPIIGVAVRGSNTPYNEDSVALPVVRRIHGVTHHRVIAHELHYPAQLSDPFNAQQYMASWRKGVRHLNAYLARKSQTCPHARFVLVGYSQGAQVVHNELARKSVPGAHRIVAVVLFGDPNFDNSKPYDRGGFTHDRNGDFFGQPSEDHGAMTAVPGHVILDFCHHFDQVCQSGAPGMNQGHLNYDKPPSQKVASRFVASKVRGRR